MKTVAILCGGTSEDHEISLLSAKSVLEAIDREKFLPIVIGISKSGIWFLESEATFYEGEPKLDRIRLNEDAPVVTLVTHPQYRKGRLESKDNRPLAEFGNRTHIEFDITFPLFKGRLGEEGRLQELLDLVGAPYVGSAAGALAACMDKAKAKAICRAAGINVTPYLIVRDIEELSTKRTDWATIGFPLMVKPCRQGASVGINRVNDVKDLQAAVEEAFLYDNTVLLERAVTGREIECAVLGSSEAPRASVPGEVLPSKQAGWYSYDEKVLLEEGIETLAPAPLHQSAMRSIQDLALRVFKALNCEGLARIDMSLESTTGKIYLNEVNTVPSFTPVSMYPKMWEASGLPYRDLISQLLELAVERKAPSRS